MKYLVTGCAVVFVLLSGLLARGNTLYVDLNSANPTPPFSDWSTAATNIQDAIDASSDGDQIWVTNGIYQTGGKLMTGTATNRVMLDKAVTVQSVNGPFVTIIAGGGATNGPNAIRCAWLTNNASLIGFTLTRGATPTATFPLSLEYGGGIWCASSNATVVDCLIVSNTAYSGGAGVYQGSLANCYVLGNSGPSPCRTVESAIVNNCTIISNSCPGLSICKTTNSICYYNSGGNYNGGSFSYSCVTPAAAGTGNFTNAPQFFTDGIHPILGSRCVGAGTTPVTSADFFGNAWANPPSIGCAELSSLPLVGAPRVQLVSSPLGFMITNGLISAAGSLNFSWLKDGVLLLDNGHFSQTQNTNLIATGITFADAGDYQVIVGNSFGSATSAVARVTIHCVNLNGANPVPPYTSWETAATNMQDAIDAAVAGEIVLVTNGIYSTGGYSPDITHYVTNRVTLNKAITVKSINGYADTVIQGQWDPASINGTGPGAVRCAALADGATLYGFTLRNGATGNGSTAPVDPEGGAAELASSNSVISNCVLTNNRAGQIGGGVAFGTVRNCFLSDNSSTIYGGAAYMSSLYNCTIKGNHLPNGDSTRGAGIYRCVVRNSIIVSNYVTQSGANTLLSNDGSIPSDIQYSCSNPQPAGAGNINVDPEFVDFGFHVMAASPCRDVGSPLYAAGFDLDEEPFANPPSMGCDEVIDSNLIGPLSVSIVPPLGHLVNRNLAFTGFATGRVSGESWTFDDGSTATNIFQINRTWTNAGTYNLTFTAYNADNPSGVSTNISVTIEPLKSPLIQDAGVISNRFQFSFATQYGANYLVQYTTNLSQTNWLPFTQLNFRTGEVSTVKDPTVTNGNTRFFRVQSQ